MSQEKTLEIPKTGLRKTIIKPIDLNCNKLPAPCKTYLQELEKDEDSDSKEIVASYENLVIPFEEDDDSSSDYSLPSSIEDWKEQNERRMNSDEYQRFITQVNNFFQGLLQQNIIGKANWSSSDSSGRFEIMEFKNYYGCVFFHGMQNLDILDEIEKKVKNGDGYSIMVHLNWGIFRNESVDDYRVFSNRVRNVARDYGIEIIGGNIREKLKMIVYMTKD